MAYKVEPDDQLLIEVQIPMTISQLRKIKEWSERQDTPESEPSDKRVVRKGKPLSPSQALVGAFLVGYALGEKIDEGTGLSDTISDWAAEHIPWPW